MSEGWLRQTFTSMTLTYECERVPIPIVKQFPPPHFKVSCVRDDCVNEQHFVLQTRQLCTRADITQDRVYTDNSDFWMHVTFCLQRCAERVRGRRGCGRTVPPRDTSSSAIVSSARRPLQRRACCALVTWSQTRDSVARVVPIAQTQVRMAPLTSPHFRSPSSFRVNVTIRSRGQMLIVHHRRWWVQAFRLREIVERIGRSRISSRIWSMGLSSVGGGISVRKVTGEFLKGSAVVAI